MAAMLSATRGMLASTRPSTASRTCPAVARPAVHRPNFLSGSEWLNCGAKIAASHNQGACICTVLTRFPARNTARPPQISPQR